MTTLCGRMNWPGSMPGEPQESKCCPSGENLWTVCMPSSTQYTTSSGPIWMPCVRVLNMPSPQERRKLPSRSKTITGCSLRWKTYTLALQSTATPATSMNSQPDGSFSQFSTGVKSRIPLPTTVAIMCLLMSEKSGSVPNKDCIIAQTRTLDQPDQTAYDSIPSQEGLQS